MKTPLQSLDLKTDENVSVELLNLEKNGFKQDSPECDQRENMVGAEEAPRESKSVSFLGQHGETWRYRQEEKPRCWSCGTRFFWYWRHPFFRILFPVLIMVLNFYIYAVDPVAESKREVSLPIVGSLWSILSQKWNGEAKDWVLRVFVLLVAFIGGPLIGWWFLHRLVLKRWLKLSMFGWYSNAAKTEIHGELDEYKGSWFSMTITTIFWGYICIQGYNAVVPADFVVNEWLGFDEYLFGQMAVSLSWMGDSFTFFMILDSMMQEKSKYQHSWNYHYGTWWVEQWGGMFRVAAVWICFLIGSIIVISKVWVQNNSSFEYWHLDHGYTTSESQRAFIGALIFGLDIAIVTQDWDFPLFRNTQKVMITGFTVFEVSFPPRCLKEMLPESFNFKINGKWMNYFPMFVVMGLDMAAFVALAWYEPGEFAQYIGPDNNIWTVNVRADADSLGTLFMISETYDLLNYTIRAGACIDFDVDECNDVTSGDSLCHWFGREGYCVYDHDIKLAGSFEDSTTWWTSFPIVLFFGVMIFAFYFLGNYLEKPEKRVDNFVVGNEVLSKAAVVTVVD